MVDISEKSASTRMAIAQSLVNLPAVALKALQENNLEKGSPISIAEIAGIMAAKRVHEIIPLCHLLPLTKVIVKGQIEGSSVLFKATCKTVAQTGVEMEALTAASVAALTLYDMLKAVSKDIVIYEIKLLYKEGGKSGVWEATK